MKKVSVSLVAFVVALNASGQTNNIPGPTPRMIAYKSLPNEEPAEDVQGNFINQTWRNGTVSFRGSLQQMHVPLIFDVYSNKLYFLQDGLIMDFTQPIREFTIGLAVRQDTVALRYRSAYPAIHKNTDETFYEVLVDGKFQLLRCKAKTIALYKEKDVPEEERDYSKELFYAFVSGGRMILAKADKEYLLQEMPEHADAIQKICSDKKLKLKNEKQLRELFVELNK